MEATFRSLGLLVVAGLLEIGRGCLVRLLLRDGRGWLLGAIDGAILFAYGVIPTFQPAGFGRTYAAYGGFFIVLSLRYGWWIDWDLIGGAIALIGALIIFYGRGRWYERKSGRDAKGAAARLVDYVVSGRRTIATPNAATSR